MDPANDYLTRKNSIGKAIVRVLEILEDPGDVDALLKLLDAHEKAETGHTFAGKLDELERRIGKLEARNL